MIFGVRSEGERCFPSVVRVSERATVREPGIDIPRTEGTSPSIYGPSVKALRLFSRAPERNGAGLRQQTDATGRRSITRKLYAFAMARLSNALLLAPPKRFDCVVRLRATVVGKR